MSNKRQILVTGTNGQLGTEIRKISVNYPEFDFRFVRREQVPLEKKDVILAFLDQVKPHIIINAGAYTAVDKAENEKEVVNQINHLALDTLSFWCSKNNSKLIHISTDYVFDGTSEIPYNEDDFTNPINWYGETKLRGEQAIRRNLDDAIIIRTSWVYSEYGNNFVKTMLGLMASREGISVVNDQIGAPTYAFDLAEVIMKIVSSKWEPGIFHYSNEGKISWYDFAVKIKEFSGLSCKVEAVSSEQFPTIAKRPNYSLLDKTKIKNIYKVIVPAWEDSLKQCLELLKK